MKRTLAAILAASAVLVSIAACDATVDDGWRGRDGDPCLQMTSCGTCTPVVGCGWCTFADGTGACVQDPDECARAASFSFAWEPSACHAAADAGVAPADASTAPADAGSDAVDAGSDAVDAGRTAVDAAVPDASDAGTAD